MVFENIGVGRKSVVMEPMVNASIQVCEDVQNDQ